MCGYPLQDTGFSFAVQLFQKGLVVAGAMSDDETPQYLGADACIGEVLSYPQKEADLSAVQVNSEVDSDDVQELLGSHDHKLKTDKLIEIHEHDIEKKESLEPVYIYSEDRMRRS
ncbi:hypothetical protein TNCV_1099351 [Trichonephila clavipes]|nr:hypothetical protein TNCV_1099351 [Trichonephila clavipes]